VARGGVLAKGGGGDAHAVRGVEGLFQVKACRPADAHMYIL